MLGTADVFENLGVAAYNGAGQLIKNVDYLAAAGSIVSVEARHAAAIRDLLARLRRKAVGRRRTSIARASMARCSPARCCPRRRPFIMTPVTANSLA